MSQTDESDNDRASQRDSERARVSQREQGLKSTLLTAHNVQQWEGDWLTKRITVLCRNFFCVFTKKMQNLQSEPTLQFIQPWHRLRTANKVRLHWVADAMGLKLAQV